MKLLVVTPYFYPQTGGLESYVYNIVQGLHKKYKWKIVVVTSNNASKKIGISNEAGIKIYRLPILFKISNTPINPFWYFQIKKIIEKEKPDAINAHAPVPFIADISSLTSKNIPLVLTYHAGSMKKGNVIFDSIISLYENLLLPLLFKRADKIICASEFVRNTIVKKYKNKAEVISPAVDTRIFKPNNKLKKRNIILFVGRYANVYPLKGLYYLLTAIKDIQDIKLHVVGEKLKFKQKNVEFLGVKSEDELAKEMQKSALLVLPSIAPMESFGMVLIEAMACKTPVIGTQMGGIPEIIKNGENGLLVPIKNVVALKNAIITLMNNPQKIKKMSENGYVDIQKHFLWKSKVKETQEILLDLVK